MKVLTKELILESNGRRVTYHNITEQVKAFVEETGVKNGLMLSSVTAHNLLCYL